MLVEEEELGGKNSFLIKTEITMSRFPQK